jgi:hypothetical protein
MAKEKIGPGRRRAVAVAVSASPRENATVILSALLGALLVMWPVAALLRLWVRL